MDEQQVKLFDSQLKSITFMNNPSQNSAINYALDHFFTLIRGPPRTAKSVMIKQLKELFTTAGMKGLILAPSNSATENIADHVSIVWNQYYPTKELHWGRKVMDEKMTIHSQAANTQSIYPPGQTHILGLQNAPRDVMKFFKQEIVNNTLGHSHHLSLKARMVSA